ncbi:hypothetical protein H310_12334 [Aphanomyces invadans]|uniref:Peptidase A2 domain-containing protein n=1 Tax=Aphanomyces invadans TaxID=157072 RepID=A0A024TI87_9STRA|nr:hypothetical protein H310_12334 [Aphanomyces invadans]ETV93768.1 hypothetical protein H310_12334 [Aphanomyces invadans]|eukprot:XP_008877577.1 hypothetical protein H310_12334 [Aphanomyces invadans]
MAQRLEEETAKQLTMAAAMEKNRQEQEESRAELDLDAVSKAMTSLKMDTKFRDAESRQEPKQSVKTLTAAIRPSQLKATVERELTREVSKAFTSNLRQYGEKTLRHAQSKKPDGEDDSIGRASQELFDKLHVAAVAAPDKKDETKSKAIGAAVEVYEDISTVCPRTVSFDINGVKALALLDSCADQAVVSPKFLLGLEGADHHMLVVRCCVST